MGQQQLLLIVLGVIIVGIAVIVGITLYHSYSLDANRNNITNELVNLAADAQKYYRKPREYGGGSLSFIGYTIPSSLKITASGNFEFNGEVTANELTIIGTGTEVVTNTDTIKVSIRVLPDTYNVTIIN